MAFIVPALAANTQARSNFGACLIPMTIPDPGGTPATGIVRLRGAVSRQPQGQPPRVPPGNLVHLFTLPPGMRPAQDRWLTCQVTTFISQCDGRATLCIVRRTGAVHVEIPGIGYDGAVYFDGVSFFAEGRSRRLPGTKAPRKARRG